MKTKEEKRKVETGSSAKSSKKGTSEYRIETLAGKEKK